MSPRHAFLRAGALALALAAACGNGGPADTAPASLNAAPLEPSSLPSGALPSPPLASPQLPDGTRRVNVIVLPGDALVEVDGTPARRRDGVIELLGRVDEVHRLHIYKGAASLDREVSIPEPGTSVPLVDLNAPPPARAPAATAASSSAEPTTVRPVNPVLPRDPWPEKAPKERKQR